MTDLEECCSLAKSICQRLSSERRGAIIAWANWEALNDLARLETRFAVQAGELGMIQNLQGIRLSLASDAILTTFRMSDPPGQNERLTLCHLAKVLRSEKFKKQLSSSAWLQSQGRGRLMAWETSAQDRRIQRFCRRVPTNWANTTDLDVSSLAICREQLKPTRDSILAHSLTMDGLRYPKVQEIRRFVTITSKLTELANLIFLGSTVGHDQLWENHSREADEFWKYLHAGIAHAVTRPLS